MKRFCSIFSQLLELFPRVEFEQRVREHKVERHAPGFQQLDPIYRDAVLSIGARPLLAGDLR